MEIGFIGLGNMGFPMARRLIQEQPRCRRLRHEQRGARAHRRLGGTHRVIAERGRRSR